MHTLATRDEGKQRSRGRPPPAPAPRTPHPLQALQHAAGNRAVTHLLQRVVRDTAGKQIDPKRSVKRWAALTPDQRTWAYRMVNDVYRLYEFDDAADLFDVLEGAKPDPGAKKDHWRKSGSSKTTGAPLGVQDPLFEHHTRKATGGLLVKRQQTGFGAPIHVFGATSKHVSNWASFVDLHHDGARKKLEKAGKFVNPAEAELTKLHAEAIVHADVMDKQEVTEGEQLTLSSRDAVWAGVAVEQAVNAMWKLVARELATSRKSYAKARLPRWGQLQKGGMGTSVSATFRADGRQSVVAGSGADKEQFKPPWLVELDRRVDGVSLKSTYILGHLLNDNLGGPSAPYNIVPLTSNANGVHLNIVETVVKKKVLQMYDQMGSVHSPPRDPITEVTYGVTANYDGHPRRPHTNGWVDAYNFLLHITQQMKGQGGFKRSMSVGAFHNVLMLGTFSAFTVDGVNMTLNDAWAARLKPFMDVVAYDRLGTTVAQALERIDVISDVWLKEEELVPTKLLCHSTTMRGDDEDADGTLANVPIVNDIASFRMIEPVRG